MQKLRIALILMIVFVALASWYKNQRRQAETAVATDAPTAESPATAQPNAAPPPPSATDGGFTSTQDSGPQKPSSHATDPRSIDPENQTLIRECLAKSPALPRVNLTDRTTLEDILLDLSAKPDSAKMTVHVKRANGREERLLAQPHEEANKDSYKIENDDLRVFDVDSEGFPVAKDFPRELKRDSLAHAVNAFIGDDRVTFRERRLHFTFDGGVATSVETNGATTELQLNFGRTTLGCVWQNETLNCACL